MQLKIKLIDKDLPVPAYQTSGAVAFDLYAREKTVIKPSLPTVVPLNVVIQFPKGYVLMLAIRSSVPIKKCLVIANGVGVIDQDYSGEDDEIGVELLNVSSKNVTVERGERIAQAMLIPVAKVKKFTIVPAMKRKSRGGFGSTGR